MVYTAEDYFNQFNKLRIHNLNFASARRGIRFFEDAIALQRSLPGHKAGLLFLQGIPCPCKSGIVSPTNVDRIRVLKVNDAASFASL